MRRLGCVSMLLLLGGALLAGLSPVAVATARRETVMAASRDEWRGRARAVDSLGNAPEEPPPATAGTLEDGEDVIGRRKEEVVVRISHRRFRSRRIPATQVQFGGRIPFTADYHSVHRHPPTHN